MNRNGGVGEEVADRSARTPSRWVGVTVRRAPPALFAGRCFREGTFGPAVRNAHPVKRKTGPFGFDGRAGPQTRAWSL